MRNTYPLHITISIELNDVSSINQLNRGENNGDYYTRNNDLLQ